MLNSLFLLITRCFYEHLKYLNEQSVKERKRVQINRNESKEEKNTNKYDFKLVYKINFI